MMRADGVSDYESFAREVLERIGERPISFEVCADDEAEMERQARKIASWPGQVYVKIRVTNTKGESTANLVRRLSGDGIRVNVTALMTIEQLPAVRQALGTAVPALRFLRGE